MAQLIKLQDYISRYETDMFRYPGQFIRLKKSNWAKLKEKWENGTLEAEAEEIDSGAEEEEASPSLWKRVFRKKGDGQDDTDEAPRPTSALPKTEEELKQYFLDDMLSFQLKWASTTLKRKSFFDPSFYHESRLQYFLQRFPDTFLVMYHPIVRMKQAPMEAEIMIITPIGIDIIHVIDPPPGTRSLIPSEDHSWLIETEDGGQNKILSPMYALNRSETFVRSVLSKHEMTFPFQKIVLAPDVPIVESQPPYNTHYIGKERYNEWFREKRKLSSPLKHNQLKVGEVLLMYTQRTAVNRPEWDREGDIT
ncbi:NERD domain-containing protein [Thalassobacillus sp. CUG 92003]|uniref:NERD domain-containing protein n=1 Tax=Thalassobacillus sp. CUG 92003 TaxID=2736641 RepID=UPI0015E7270E|nr:NERD domain-containing protein [Thalassobacillus sp. CUG 92003]